MIKRGSILSTFFNTTLHKRGAQTEANSDCHNNVLMWHYSVTMMSHSLKCHWTIGNINNGVLNMIVSWETFVKTSKLFTHTYIALELCNFEIIHKVWLKQHLFLMYNYLLLFLSFAQIKILHTLKHGLCVSTLTRVYLLFLKIINNICLDFLRRTVSAHGYHHIT